MAGWAKVSGVSGTASGATLSLGSIAAGLFVRCQVRIGAGGTAPTVSDNLDGSYTLARAGQDDGLGDKLYEFFLFPTVNTGARTITVSSSGGTIRIDASWFTPPTGTTSVAVSSSNGATGSATSVSSGSVTAALGDLVCGANATENSGGTAWTAGGTSAGGAWATDQAFNAATQCVYSQFVVATSAGTFTSAATLNASQNMASLAIVYAATVGGGGGGSPPRQPIVSREAHRRSTRW